MAIDAAITGTNIILAFLGTLLGVVAGIGVALFAEEEMEDALKYLSLMQTFLFVLSVVFFTFSFNLHYALIFIISMAALALSIILRIVLNRIHYSMALYGAIIILFFLATKNVFLLVFQSSVLFLFGLPLGSVLAYEFIIKKRHKLKNTKNKTSPTADKKKAKKAKRKK